jgi:acyl carrier protein
MRTVLYALVACCLIAGCHGKVEVDKAGSSTEAKASSSSGPDLRLVQGVLAELLQVDASTIKPDATFADLGADELDLVEVVMEVEDRLDVRIPDEAIAGPPSAPQEDVTLRLTVKELAAVVTAARKSP